MPAMAFDAPIHAPHPLDSCGVSPLCERGARGDVATEREKNLPPEDLPPHYHRNYLKIKEIILCERGEWPRHPSDREERLDGPGV